MGASNGSFQNTPMVVTCLEEAVCKACSYLFQQLRHLRAVLRVQLLQRQQLQHAQAKRKDVVADVLQHTTACRKDSDT